MTDVLIGLGSNVGDRLTHLRYALAGLRTVLRHVQVSHVYETSPVGVLTQPPFLNAAVRGKTTEGPQRLFFWAKSLEFATGRRPGPRLGPRQLDLDIIAFGDLVVATSALAHSARSVRGAGLRTRAAWRTWRQTCCFPARKPQSARSPERAGRAGVERAYPPESLTAPR